MKLFRQIKGLSDSNSETEIKFADLWKRVFLDSVYKNSSERPIVKKHNMYSNGNALLSGTNKITYFYTIDGYPRDLPIDFKDVIRNEARGYVRISFISLFDRTIINWDSYAMKAKMRSWKNLDEDMEDINAFNYRENSQALENNEWRKESLVYLSDAEKRRERKLFKYRSMMVISGDRGRDFDETIDEVLNYCNNIGLKVTRVEENLSDFLRTFSPFSLSYDSNVFKQCGNTTIPDEMIARMSSYDQGKVGRYGDYWGTDIHSGFPVYKLFKKTDVDAENILITAETGGGKSYFAKGLILQLIGKSYVNGTIMDVEGFEYTPFASFIANNSDVVRLNMAEGTGSYYDPVEIVNVDVEFEDEDMNMFSFSKSFTLSLFKTLLGKSFLEKNEWAGVIVNDAIAKTYAYAGVTADQSTWSNSIGLTIHDVYENMKDLYYEILDDNINPGEDIISMYKNNIGYRDALDLVIAKLSVYFESIENGGTRSDVFSDRVTLDSIKDAKLVVCSFGMAGKSADMVDPIQMALSQLSAANIAHLRSVFSKEQGKYNFKVWEEFQRWGDFPDSEKTISTALTGGRKLGDINFVITNDVKKLLDNDRFGVFGNITSFAIGAIDDALTRRKLIERLTIPLLQDDLDRIVTNKGSNESFGGNAEYSSPYDKAFLIRLDKSVSTIVKMVLPESISRSDIFRTGVNVGNVRVDEEEDLDD